jgi:NTE family protein
MIKKFFLFFAILSFVGCSMVQRRERAQPQPQPIAIPKNGEMPPTIELPKQGEGAEPLPTPDVKIPKVGVIIGPGGARAYAAIGVLRAFEKSRIPVDMIAGVEWGALMAALYSVNEKSNEMEWEAMKIPNDFVQSGFLSSKVEPRNFSDIEKYMRDFFGTKRIESGKISFSCTTDNIRNYRSLMIFRGTYKDTMGLCMAFPPFLNSNRGWVAAPYQIKYLIDQMAQRGMDYIILIDVLGTSNPLGKAKVGEETALIWSQLSKSVNQNKIYVHQVVSVPLQKSILDFSARREFIQAGEQAGGQAAQVMSQKFGL